MGKETWLSDFDGSVRLFRAGFRYLSDGKNVQRWLCRNCGYRFSESSVKVNVTRKVSESLDSGEDYHEVGVASGDGSDEKVDDCSSFASCEDVGSHGISIVEKSLYGLPFYNSKLQLCATKKAKKLDTTTETKTVAGEKGKLWEYAWKLKKRGLKEKTIEVRMFLLNQRLKMGANLDSAETILATELIRMFDEEQKSRQKSRNS